MICGKELTNEESVKIGMGEVCANKLSNFANSDIHNSSFFLNFITINGESIAIIIDKDSSGKMSVTNAIDSIAKDLKVTKVIYRDSNEVWDYWSAQDGFKTLGINGISTINMDDAIEIAKVRYFGVLGGLFEGVGQ